MNESITARSLIVTSVPEYPPETPLRKIIPEFASGGEKGMAAIVRHEGGDYAGLLTPGHLITAINRRVLEDEEKPDTEQLVSRIGEHVEDPVSEYMARDVPIASPQDNLLILVELASGRKTSCLPVMERGTFTGLVFVSDIFKAAAGLALTPGNGGIVA